MRLRVPPRPTGTARALPGRTVPVNLLGASPAARAADVLAAGMLLAVSFLAASASAQVSDGDAPAAEAVVARLHRGLVEASSSEPDASLDTRLERLRPLIAGTHDLPYIAELAIRRQWRDLAAADRERFAAAFERLSVMTYVSQFSAVDANAFTIVGSADAGSRRIEVNATISRGDGGDGGDGGDITLDYTLQERDGDWMIVNVLADGVSDLALKRAEYRRILDDGTIDDLIDHLSAQANDLM